MPKAGLLCVGLNSRQCPVEPAVVASHHYVVVRSVQVPELGQSRAASLQHVRPTWITRLSRQRIGMLRFTVVGQSLNQVFGSQDTYIEMAILRFEVTQDILQ